MATREQIYREQLQALGIYDPAFDPAIGDLAQLDRDMTRARKAWSATVPRGQKPSMLDPHYQLILQLRRERQALRESLGLTPKALRKLRGTPEAPVPEDLIAERLAAIQERVNTYTVPDLSKLDSGDADE